MTLQVALQMDALARLNLKSDSTLYVAAAAALRGYSLFHYEPQRLRLEVLNGMRRISALGHMLTHEGGVWKQGAEETRDLTTFNIILMRQDPPFDLAYITATHILELLPKSVRVVNDPAGVRNAPEKLLILDFPQFMPPTLIARDAPAIRDFHARYGDIIVKPLHGFAGHGIFHMRADDDNLPALLETLGTMNSEPWMVQKFLPVATLGDKRIVVLDGEPVGVFKRMPVTGDIRGNMRVGGRAELAPLTKRDREICEALSPVLKTRGLFLAGIDVIGDYLTEINVTSPTGLITADQLEGRSGKDTIAEQFWTRLVG
jgi:glutathione synthase